MSKEATMKAAIERSTVVKRCDHQMSCSLNDESAILTLQSTLYYGLDEVGACIWQALEEPRQVVELCKVVSDDFDVSEAACEADVVTFLTTLHEAGLIETTAGQGVDRPSNA